MQTFTQAPTAATAPPAPAAPPATFVYVGGDGNSQAVSVPQTRDEVRAIRAQREQISDQLENISSRRNELARELARTGPEAARTGLESRIQLLDKRILQLESDLAITGRQLELASGQLVASSEAPSNPGDHFEDGLLVGGFSVFGFMAIMFLFLRRSMKRRFARRGAPQLGDDATRRLERLENGMDAIAIEIERVSEGQRFVTKLLSDARSPSAEREKVGERLGS